MICVLADLLDVTSSDSYTSAIAAISAFLEPFLLLKPALLRVVISVTTELVFPAFLTDLAVFVVVENLSYVMAFF